jgi:hypothetical protein
MAAAANTAMSHADFFTEYGEANRFVIHEMIGKGSYGVVCSATDTKTGAKVHYRP